MNLEEKFTNFEEKFTGFEEKFTDFEEKFIGFEGKFTNLEKKVSNLEGNYANLEENVVDIKKHVIGLESTLENVTNKNIRIIAEAHSILNRKLDDALKAENEKEMLLIRVNILENDMKKVKERLEETA